MRGDSNSAQFLFRVSFRATPSPKHPRFFDWEFCALAVWLLDESETSARERATNIVTALPYHLVEGREPMVIGPCDPGKFKHPTDQEHFEILMSMGFSIQVFGAPVGADPEGFCQPQWMDS